MFSVNLVKFSSLDYTVVLTTGMEPSYLSFKPNFSGVSEPTSEFSMDTQNKSTSMLPKYQHYEVVTMVQ